MTKPTKKPEIKPFRYTVEWCSAELALEDAQQHYDLIVQAIESDRGFVQGGLVQKMADEDVILGSPLDFALRRKRQ